MIYTLLHILWVLPLLVSAKDKPLTSEAEFSMLVSSSLYDVNFTLPRLGAPGKFGFSFEHDSKLGLCFVATELVEKCVETTNKEDASKCIDALCLDMRVLGKEKSSVECLQGMMFKEYSIFLRLTHGEPTMVTITFMPGEVETHEMCMNDFLALCPSYVTSVLVSGIEGVVMLIAWLTCIASCWKTRTSTEISEYIALFFGLSNMVLAAVTILSAWSHSCTTVWIRESITYVISGCIIILFHNLSARPDNKPRGCYQDCFWSTMFACHSFILIAVLIATKTLDCNFLKESEVYISVPFWLVCPCLSALWFMCFTNNASLQAKAFVTLYSTFGMALFAMSVVAATREYLFPLSNQTLLYGLLWARLLFEAIFCFFFFTLYTRNMPPLCGETVEDLEKPIVYVSQAEPTVQEVPEMQNSTPV